MLDILQSRLITLKNSGFTPRTILDIGAHQGSWSKLVRQIWPESTIFMIEANTDHKQELQQVAWTNGFEIALLGEKAKKAVDYYASTSAFDTGNSIFREQTSFFDNCEIRKLPMVTLDSIVKKRNLKNIDFIKLDTQGSELNILKGAKKTILHTEFILLETQNLEYNLGAPDTCDVLLFMKNLGFQLFDITEIHHLPTGEMLQVDLLFARNDSKFILRKSFM